MTIPSDQAVETTPRRSFSITPRVIAILAACDRFGFLTSEQLWRVDGGSRQKVIRILQKCTEAGLLAQPRHQHPVTAYFDQRPRVFGCTKRGAQALVSAGIEVDLDIDRAARNRRAVLLQHTIEVADTIFQFEAACAAHGLQLLDQPQLRRYLPPHIRDLQRPCSIGLEVSTTDFPHLARLLTEPVRIAAEPDRLVVLARPDATGWALAIEVDRGHETVFARRLKSKTSILRKQMAYFAAWRTGLITQRWGDMCRSLRVAIITNSEGRLKTMLASQNEVTRGSASGLFVYTTGERLKAHGALGNIWSTTRHERISLLDRQQLKC